jgi:CBS domain containing-hemolysin-like protein
LRGTTTIADLAEMYGIALSEPPESTLEQVIGRRATEVAVGATAVVDGVQLRVREMSDGRILSIGLALRRGEQRPDASRT